MTLPLDICVVAGRRPELLFRTLSSFQSHVFKNFEINRFLVNIDPVFGNLRDLDDTIATVRCFTPNAEIQTPDTASFGKAVKSLWGMSTANLLLHLEDDWLALHPINSTDIERLLSHTTKAVFLRSVEHGKIGEGGFYSEIAKKRRLGIQISKRTVPKFGTSPRFIDGPFAREVAKLMNPTLDPEKQMRRPFNPALNTYLEHYRCQALTAPNGGMMVQDIGREWRDARSIVKTVQNGTSVWTQM